MLTQREISKIAGAAQPTIGKWAKIAGLSMSSPHDLLILMCITELTHCNLSGNEAAEIIAQCRSEITYLAGGNDRTAYLMLFRSGKSKAVLVQPVLNLRNVEALLESTPAAQVVALHFVMARAAARLANLQEH
jgi:hypothetical protein